MQKQLGELLTVGFHSLHDCPNDCGHVAYVEFVGRSEDRVHQHESEADGSVKRAYVGKLAQTHAHMALKLDT